MKDSILWGVVKFLEKQSKETILLISLELIILLGMLDYATGYEISFSLFYLIPVSLAAWFVGRRPGLLISTASALISTLFALTRSRSS
ncbi:MAG: hypothetical protein ACWGO1_00795, partial [Anaerolineales bacterium]